MRFDSVVLITLLFFWAWCALAYLESDRPSYVHIHSICVLKHLSTGNKIFIGEEYVLFNVAVRRESSIALSACRTAVV